MTESFGARRRLRGVTLCNCSPNRLRRGTPAFAERRMPYSLDVRRYRALSMSKVRLNDAGIIGS